MDRMDATFRRTMTNVTDVLFPVSKTARDPQRQQIIKPGNEYVTNLPLQMALFFNACYSPLWMITSAVVIEAKFAYLNMLYQIIVTAVFIAYSIIEIVRLYLGYVGNLMERVPELAGFWLLTVLLQLPLILLMTFNEDAKIVPLERAVNIVKALFIVFEVICGYFAIRIMVNYQVTKFHLQQFTDLEQIEDPYYQHDDGYVM
ncbi:transmembrane protein 17-like [Haliotis rufescens]|uniref:transmembrane protein 17-like n=1 Tax=Haliotis rufescens TaxID=6454 RepID=UPI001EB02970|nr:transmembrane protein 17-like [Haliotis rufescens]